jgi:hypothetical protein
MLDAYTARRAHLTAKVRAEESEIEARLEQLGALTTLRTSKTVSRCASLIGQRQQSSLRH